MFKYLICEVVSEMLDSIEIIITKSLSIQRYENMKNTAIYVIFIDRARLKKNMLKHKKNVCLKRMFATQRKMFALKDC